MKRSISLVAIAIILATTALVMHSPKTAQAAENCPTGYVIGDFNLCYGMSVAGDVRVDKNILYDGSASTGLVVTCWRQPYCIGYAEWGANVSDSDVAPDNIRLGLLNNGCGSRCTSVDMVTCSSARCPSPGSPTVPPPASASPYNRIYFGPGTPVIGGWIYINGSYVGYSCYVPSAWGTGYVDGGTTYPQFYSGASVTNCSGGTFVPVPAQPVYPPPTPPVYYTSGTTTAWAGNLTMAVSGPGSWMMVNGQPFTDCWFPSTPSGSGMAINAVPNTRISNPLPTNLANLPLCKNINTSNGPMEIRTRDWYTWDGWAKVQGIAIALNNQSICNSGNCVVDQATAATIGGRVWYLAPMGSPEGSVSPFTPAYSYPQTPITVFPGRAETQVR